LRCQCVDRAVRRARSWYPGTDVSPATLAISGALRVLDAAAERGPDPDAEEALPPGGTPAVARCVTRRRQAIDDYTIYRLILACPFPEDVIPPRSPADGAPEHDPFAMARSIGRVFDKVVLPTLMLRPASTALVRWASEWINAVATVRRRLRTERVRAVRVQPPGASSPGGRPASCSPARSQPTSPAREPETAPAPSPDPPSVDSGHDPGTVGTAATGSSPGGEASLPYDDDP